MSTKDTGKVPPAAEPISPTGSWAGGAEGIKASSGTQGGSKAAAEAAAAVVSSGMVVGKATDTAGASPKAAGNLPSEAETGTAEAATGTAEASNKACSVAITWQGCRCRGALDREQAASRHQRARCKGRSAARARRELPNAKGRITLASFILALVLTHWSCAEETVRLLTQHIELYGSRGSVVARRVILPPSHSMLLLYVSGYSY